MKTTIIKLVVLGGIILCIIITLKCSGTNNSGKVSELQPIGTNSATEEIAFSETDLCKAVIATQFYKPVKIISVYEETANEVRVQYERTEDQTIWKNKCKVEGNTIVWGAVDPDRIGDEQAGRWRTRYSEGDDKITYSVDNESLILTTTNQYSDESSTQVFHQSDFTQSK